MQMRFICIKTALQFEKGNVHIQAENAYFSIPVRRRHVSTALMLDIRDARMSRGGRKRAGEHVMRTT